MRNRLLISAALFLALTAAVYAAFPPAPGASQAAPGAAPFAAAVCCTPMTDAASGEVTMLEVEMTPLVKQAPSMATAGKSDARFANYALENAAGGGQ